MTVGAHWLGNWTNWTFLGNKIYLTTESILITKREQVYHAQLLYKDMDWWSQNNCEAPRVYERTFCEKKENKKKAE